jgi:hypothetical protein
MVACLKEVDPVVRHAIDKPVLLSDPPRAAAFKHIAKRFRFPQTLKGITPNCLNKVKQPDSRITIRSKLDFIHLPCMSA